MAQPPPAREWTRARAGAWLGGVARGLADRLGVPPAAVRLAFVVAALVGGWGVVVYLALWILMPREPLALPPAVVATSEAQPASPAS
jgi:phage shock protein PspC (stress-responsive transcriptional regulator)